VSDGQNTNSAQALVTVVDTKPPTIQCGTNKVIKLGNVWSFDTPVASDSCYGTNVTITVVDTVTNNSGCALDITRTWQATDGSGNSSLASQIVTLVDIQPLDLSSLRVNPLILRPNSNRLVPVTIEGTVTNACGATAECWIASVTDNEGKAGHSNSRIWDYKITGARTLILRAQPRGRRPTTYQIIMSAKDACGNTGTRTIPVTVQPSW
jgi:HYR domain